MSKADNKIRIIDLLNKIANGEEVPKRIKSEDREFWFKEDETSIDYLYRTDKNGNGWLVVQDLALNDWVEILEDNIEEIEELKRTENVYDMTLECYHDIEKKISNDELADKINEIIRYIKRKDKNND